MSRFKYLILAAAVLLMAGCEGGGPVQVGLGVQAGPPPLCPYGYFAAPPYECAPYGYYGPEWFSDGVFIGAGPWFRGPRRFRGRIDNHYDRDHGYRGDYPHRGDRPDRDHPPGHYQNFRGNERRDGRGHEYGHRR